MEAVVSLMISVRECEDGYYPKAKNRRIRGRQITDGLGCQRTNEPRERTSW